MDKLPSIAHFAAATFFGNVAFSAMGFGMAICFLFVYQVGSLAGVPDLPGLKYAVFVQTIGMAVIQPIVLWNVDLRKNFRIEMMLTMLAMQLVGAPLGLVLQEHTPAAILKIIVGVVTIMVAAHQIFNTYMIRKKELKARKYEMVVAEGDEYEPFTAPVYFIIGTIGPEGGRLQDMVSERGLQIATPPPADILQHFTPIVAGFGDDTKALVSAVCDFVESNPTPWTDLNNNPISLNPASVVRRCRGRSDLVSVFEAVQEEYCVLRNCSTWLCSAPSAPRHHEVLQKHFGERLRYIYLYRDVRDVVVELATADLSTPNQHYVLAEMWSEAQETAQDMASSAKTLKINYETLVRDQTSQLHHMEEFVKGCSTSTYTNGVNAGIPWGGSEDLSEEEVAMVEAAAHKQMTQLGYILVNPHLTEYNQGQVREFRRMAEVSLQENLERLRKTDPQKWDNIQRQGDILKTDTIQLSNGDHGALLEQGGDVNSAMLLEQGKEVQSATSTGCAAATRQFLRNAKQELWPIRPVIIWMTVAGLLSGFLAGLIGVRSPPLIIFFFIYEYPKPEVRANGSLIAMANTVVRVLTYMATSPGEDYGHPAWFQKDDIILYVVVAAVAILATPAGLYLTRFLQKSGYKVALTLLLIVNGITMMTTAGLDIAAGNTN